VSISFLLHYLPFIFDYVFKLFSFFGFIISSVLVSSTCFQPDPSFLHPEISI